jgi:hypothetical protein
MFKNIFKSITIGNTSKMVFDFYKTEKQINNDIENRKSEELNRETIKDIINNDFQNRETIKDIINNDFQNRESEKLNRKSNEKINNDNINYNLFSNCLKYESYKDCLNKYYK